MATITDRKLALQILREGGFYETDPQVVRMYQYISAGSGEQCFALFYSRDEDDLQGKDTQFCLGVRMLWDGVLTLDGLIALCPDFDRDWIAQCDGTFRARRELLETHHTWVNVYELEVKQVPEGESYVQHKPIKSIRCEAVETLATLRNVAAQYASGSGFHPPNYPYQKTHEVRVERHPAAPIYVQIDVLDFL